VCAQNIYNINITQPAPLNSSEAKAPNKPQAYMAICTVMKENSQNKINLSRVETLPQIRWHNRKSNLVEEGQMEFC
jgi:hypothetical protein